MEFTRQNPAQRRERLDRYVRPLQDFTRTEASSGLLLILGAVLALAWANSPWADGYQRLFEHRVAFDLGFYSVAKSLHALVNDGAMTLFFFVVGLEIKRELTVGELRSRRRVVLPLCAALGGVVVPALIFVALVHDPELRHGWGVPIATDIAFALGVMALLGPRVGAGLKALLLAIAIFDDIAAIGVIAAFYTDQVVVAPLLIALLMLGLAWVAQQIGIWYVPLYVVFGVLAWFGVLESGVHPTIVGVAFGLLTPWRGWGRPEALPDRAGALLQRLRPPGEPGEAARGGAGHEAQQQTLLHLRKMTSQAVAPLDRLEHELHALVAFGIVPLFAFANAGVALGPSALSAAAGSPLTWAVLLALAIGKPAGILAGTWVAVRAGARVPPGVTWSALAGLGVLAGIGFTVSLFITELAFTDEAAAEAAKLGIIGASVVAGVGGYVALRVIAARRRRGTEPPPA